MGDILSQYVWYVAITDESASKMARVLMEECVLRFGPLQRLLSDRGLDIMSEVISELCKYIGVRKI